MGISINGFYEMIPFPYNEKLLRVRYEYLICNIASICGMINVM